MPRWYQGFECYGKPSNVVERIRNIVRWHDLGNIVPVVRVEKEAKRGRFLLFLAIESPIVGEVPIKVRTTIFHLYFLKKPFLKPFSYEEISSTVGAELDVHNYARSIPYPYRQFEAAVIENPFEIADTMLDLSSDPDQFLINTQRYDRLMLWISAVGSGTWKMFRNACQTLQLDKDGTKSRSIIRHLRLLGHLETSLDGSYWSVAPAVLVRSNNTSEEESYFLCGQRDIALLQALRQLATVQEYAQKGNAPASIWISGSNIEQILPFLKASSSRQQLRVGENVSYRLAQLLPFLNDWMNTLERLDGILPHMYTLKQYDGTGFINALFQGKSGLYELWPLEKATLINKPIQTLFYDENGKRWLRGDWYGLRFLALQSNGNSCTVRYDAASERLAVPEEWHWPELYERALVIASGYLPSKHGSWLIYEAIQPDLLESLSAKLNLKRETLRHMESFG